MSALCIREMSGTRAAAHTGAGFKHGPNLDVDATHVAIIFALGHTAELGVKLAQECNRRGGKVVLISDKRGIDAAGDQCWHTVEVPDADPFIAPMLYALPVQMLAYHTAVAKGTDVDQPRNLAKSVTVE